MCKLYLQTIPKTNMGLAKSSQIEGTAANCKQFFVHIDSI